jgi:hypothetical protein
MYPCMSGISPQHAGNIGMVCALFTRFCMGICASVTKKAYVRIGGRCSFCKSKLDDDKLSVS